MRTILNILLNILWILLGGIPIAIGYMLAALICFILIVTIPFGIAALRIALFAVWPFGRTVVKRPGAGIASGVGSILWLVLCGWWLTLFTIIFGVLLCITIIGIPLGLGWFKTIRVSLFPFGREIVSVAQAKAMKAEALVIAA